ncbi:hypothetical protein Acsp03_58510 [Actinomadura sp. NBRC 104412]|nr:hypothetical protein Acsp03_58510 [Actinomadura sp. NBRC 104412]
MSPNSGFFRRMTGRIHRLIGGGFILSALLSQSAGYAAIAELPALQAAAWYATGGAVALTLWNMRAGRLPKRGMGLGMWWLIVRMAVSDTVISVSFLYSVQELGIGPAAAAVSFGLLMVDGAKFWRHRTTSWGRYKISIRVVALAAILLANEPWNGEATVPGAVAAVISCFCFWNFTVVINKMTRKGLGDQGTTAAMWLSTPAIWGLLLLLWAIEDALSALPWLGRFVSGIAGDTWLPPEQIGLALVAGLFILFIPMLLQVRGSARLSAGDLGLWLLSDSAMAAVVGLIGSGLGLIAASHHPSLLVWAGIAILMIASVFNTLMPDDPPRQGQIT